ncbi:MAG: ROK family protein [Elusimicrobiota bacterium]|nr:ROK family protein [Elusimicrobiota bacterium]
MSTKYVLGIDIGGTETKIGVVKYDTSTKSYALQECFILTTVKGNVGLTIENIRRTVNEIRSRYGKLTHCGVGVAALINFRDGVVVNGPNLGWVNINLRSKLEQELKLNVIIDNDANLSTLAIYHHEVKKKYKKVDSMVCLTLGTGIGGGIILNGDLFHGNPYSAAELGHITMNIDGGICGCGNTGCIERYVGARWFIAEIIKELKIDKPKTVIYELVENNLNNLTPKILYLAAEKGDKYALVQWQLYGKLLGIAISTLVNIFSPEVIAFTGGVSLAHKYFLPYLKKEVERRVWPVLRKKNNPSPLIKDLKYHIAAGQNYGVLGAGILAVRTFL